MNAHDKNLTAAVTILGWLLAGCTGGDLDFAETYRGAAAFDSQSSAKLFLARPEGYRVRRLASPWDSSEAMFEDDEPLYGGASAPRAFPEPNGSRLLVDGISFAFGSGGFFEIGESGANDIGLDGQLLDLHWGTNVPWLMHQASDYTIRFTVGPSNPGGTWTTAAGTTESNCVNAGTAIVAESGNSPVAFCGGNIMTLGTGADLVVNTSGTFAFSVVADGVRGTDGTAKFFFLAAGEGATTRLHRMQRDVVAPSGWSSQEIASLAGAPFEGSHAIFAANETALAVVSRSCTTDDLGELHCSGDLHAIWNDGVAWQSELIGALPDDDGLEGLSATASANEAPRILTGSIKLYMHSRSGTWTSEELGALGVQTDGVSCAAGRGSAPGGVLALLLLAPALMLRLRRY